MKELCVENGRDIPRDFLQKFWIEPGDDFVTFLTTLKDKGLSFVLEAPDNAPGISDQISEQIARIKTRGGPSIPEPSGVREGQAALLWEFLTCKAAKVKARDLRLPGPQRRPGTKEFIVIGASTKMLAPVEYKVKVIAKEFGFKDPLRQHDDDPEKFVIVGSWLSCCRFDLLRVFFWQVPGFQDTAARVFRTFITKI